MERVAPALALLAKGAYAREAAAASGVSIATILNWMDWGWRHNEEVEQYLREHHPELESSDLDSLRNRIQRRRFRRKHRRDFAEWRSST